MKKKFLLIAISFMLAFAFVACGETTVLDETDPVLSGYQNVVYVIGESATPVYTQGVTAYDNLDGNITSKITVNSTAVNLAVPGTYTVTYSVTDLSGNSTTASITVTVVDDGAPVISGVHGLEYVFNDPAPDYTDGLTATDNVDGDITADIVVNSSAVILTVAGIYTVTFTVEDAAGNLSAVYSTYIQVKEHADDADLIPPVFNGQTNKTYVIGVTATAPDYLTGVTATDNEDGDVTADIVVNSTDVDLTEAGVYTVTYTVEDAYGNEAIVTITVTVSLETVPPVIGGIRILEYYINEVPNYKLGLTVSDNVDKELTVDDIVVDSDAVNMQVAGRYAVLFSITDAAGNVGSAETEIIVAVNPINLVPDLTAVYRTYTSGTDNLNPYSETLATASELFGYITDSLYTGDYDWAAAEAILLEEGFTVTGDMDFADWYAAGKTAGQLPYNRYPAMAAGLPVAMDDEGLVWQITLRDDLQFQDGTPINAETFNYSWSMLLDPKLLNDRASNLYATTDLPLENAEAYFKQLSLRSDKFDFPIYIVDGKEVAREFSFSHLVTGTTWELYFVAGAEYVGIPNLYTEYWGTGYGVDGWVFVDIDDDPWYFDADGNLVAPAAIDPDTGVAYVDASGNPISATGAVPGYAGGYPAYYMDNGDGTFTRAAVDADDVPVDGVAATNDPVLWSEVGFEVIDELTIQITLSAGKTAWDVMGALTSGIVGVVHPAKYEEGMNTARTQTTYGTIDNPLSSYGPYILSVWQTDVLYMYTINPDHYDAADYRITTIRYDVIEDQSIAVSEFKEGRLDIVGAGGVYYKEFKYNKNLKLTPATTFFRFAFNIEGSDQYALNPILVIPEFRQAFYFAIDRTTFSAEVRAPSLPTHGFLGPVYLSTEYGFVSYRGSAAGQSVLADLAPATKGYDPVQAKTLFDAAYDIAVAAGDIVEGETVSVEYKYYDVETNRQIANWVESTVETIFNQGETFQKFNLLKAGVSSAALNDAWDNGDFEMTFGGWQGLNFDAPSMLGQVYNSELTYMLEKGFDTGNAPLTVSLPYSKVALEAWIAEYLLIAEPTDTQTESYDAWVALLAKFVGDDLSCTYNELFLYAYTELYNVKDVNYAGKTDDFDNITAALEGVLLDQMISIPLFTTVAATVYSTRVVFEANEYHAWMGWGGFKYMYIGKPAE